MDNYKIKVKDEAESKEAQELFFELGFAWLCSKKDITNLDVVFIYAKDGVLTAGFNDHNFAEAGHKELTLPQLRDLVVLKRNDVKDSNRQAERGGEYFITSDGDIYFWMGKWVPSTLGSTESLMAIETNPPQDPALISGAEALRALADGKEVEANNSDFGYWIDARNLSVKDFFDDIHIFRLKPQTIKLELEIPAPYKAKIGGRDDTSFVLNVGRHQYCYKNEEDYTKARDALEAVFDAAVRGTNS